MKELNQHDLQQVAGGNNLLLGIGIVAAQSIGRSAGEAAGRFIASHLF